MFSTAQKIEKAVIVGVKLSQHKRWETDDYLNELDMLVTTAGAKIMARFVQEKSSIDPKIYVGKGKLEEIKLYVEENDIDTVVFDDELSPAQIKNIENILDKKIIDRSSVILDIFASHARTREAKTQVELAQLHYTMPRLTRMWTHLSRQDGGGVGMRGPGETQLETDKRIIKTRLALLNDELKLIEQQRETQKKGRTELFRVSLIGYTNVGKSTIMNALSGSDVLVENKLFATLDSTVRKVYLNKDFQILLSDTVGFIRKLPHHLVASFKSTLNEVRDADLLLHVIDISAPNYEDHIKTVNQVIDELGVADKKQLLVFNKVDQIKNEGTIENAHYNYPNSVFVSALKKIKLNLIKEEVLKFIENNFVEHEFKLNYQQNSIVNIIHVLGNTIEESYEQDYINIKTKISKENLARVEKSIERLALENF